MLLLTIEFICNQLWIWMWTIHTLFYLCSIFRRAESPFGSGSARGGQGIQTGSGQAGWWRNAHPGVYCQIQNSKWAELNYYSKDWVWEEVNKKLILLFSKTLFQMNAVLFIKESWKKCVTVSRKLLSSTTVFNTDNKKWYLSTKYYIRIYRM